MQFQEFDWLGSHGIFVNYNPSNIFSRARIVLTRHVTEPNIPQLKLKNIQASFALGKLFTSRNRYRNVHGQISDHIFAPNGGYCLCKYIA